MKQNIFEIHVNRNSLMGTAYFLTIWVAIKTSNMTVICVKVNLLKTEDKIEQGALCGSVAPHLYQHYRSI